MQGSIYLEKQHNDLLALKTKLEERLQIFTTAASVFISNALIFTILYIFTDELTRLLVTWSLGLLCYIVYKTSIAVPVIVEQIIEQNLPKHAAYTIDKIPIAKEYIHLHPSFNENKINPL